MCKKRKPIPGLDPVRKFPYYKIQVRDEKLGVWRDIQKSFASLNTLHQYANRHLEHSLQTRIMKVTEYGKREVLESYTAFGIALNE